MKKLYFYKVKGEKIEKLHEFNFSCNFKDFNKAESIPSLFYFITITNDVFIKNYLNLINFLLSDQVL